MLLSLVANAIGLIVAAVVLDDMTLDARAFIVEVALFTVVVFVIRPLIVQTGLQHAPAITGNSALLATLVRLVVTSWVSDGLQIRGGVTWVLATIIVWWSDGRRVDPSGADPEASGRRFSESTTTMTP